MKQLLLLTFMLPFVLVQAQVYGGDFYAGIEPSIVYQNNSSEGSSSSTNTFGAGLGVQGNLPICNDFTAGAGFGYMYENQSDESIMQTQSMLAFNLNGKWFPCKSFSDEGACFMPFLMLQGAMLFGSRSFEYQSSNNMSEDDVRSYRGRVGVGSWFPFGNNLLFSISIPFMVYSRTVVDYGSGESIQNQFSTAINNGGCSLGVLMSF